MKRSTLTRGLIPTAVVLSLALAACGGDEAGTDDASTDTGAAGTDESMDDTDAAAGGEELAGTLVGAGASSQQAAVQAWVAGYNGVQPGVTVNYDPIGSGGGRELFLGGGSDFAGSDAYLDDDELATVGDVCASGDIVELPLYISPVAVIFNLEGFETVNMPPEVIAGVFAETITSWDDPAIAEANPDAELPATPIVPVHRSDDSGTTENFTSYLDTVAGDVWTYGEVETWPGDLGGEAGAQTAGVVQAVQAGDGYVGYADASQAGELGTVAVGVGEEFVEFSPEAAATVLDVSERVEGRSDTDLAIDLARDTQESGAYPIVLVSYHIACADYEDDEKAGLVKDYLTYVASTEGQQIAADNAGSAPISDTLRTDVQAAIDAIQ
ncbi:extracellular solute-binding protein [Jannaschia sp. R86511]|uniref:phosphate ABC transporter substrate-binding protein PstS n=1 Tax=Jannaschia sp. R86511 TaxID=3093853 RepID=UPI0036D39345